LSAGAFVILNPLAGKGRGRRLADEVRQAFSRQLLVEVAETRAAGDEARLVGEALGRGFETIVAVGGDGTWSNVGNAILHSGQKARLGLVPAGTGSDLAKSLDVPPRDIETCARIVAAGHCRQIDVGRIEGRHFLNIAGFGLDIAVLEDSWRVRHLQGEALYLYCALRQMFRYRGMGVEITTDGRALGHVDLLMMIVCNARVFGGKFRIAPQARMDDGRLDLVRFGNMGALRRLSIMRHLMAGTHLQQEKVAVEQAERFSLRFDQPPAYETDGEWNQARSATIDIECVPGALDVLVPPTTQAP